MTGRLCFNQTEDQLYWNGKALYRNVLGKIPQTWEEACLYVWPSPGHGPGLLEILAQLPKTSRLLLLEWDSELAEFSANYLYPLFKKAGINLIASLTSNQDFILQNESTAFLPLLAGYRRKFGTKLDYAIWRLHKWLQGNECWDSWCFRRIRILPLSRAFTLQKTAFQPVLEWLESYNQNFWQNRLALNKLGPLWLRNFFRNVAQLPHCQALPSKLTNAILVAAGPSLEQHYAWLRQERKKFTLLSVDTALLPLLCAQIIPDYVINLDAQVLNLQDFYGVGNLVTKLEQQWQRQATFMQVADLSCDPRSFTTMPFPFVLMATEFAPMSLWQRFSKLQESVAHHCQTNTKPMPLEPLGSVGVTSLAVALQCRPRFLLLLGYDFAYPKDLHHVRSTSIHQKLLQHSSRLQPLNSFAASLQRPLTNNPFVTEGFVTDKILCSYAQQLQNYLMRYSTAELVAYLDGPMKFSAIQKLNYAQASAALNYYYRKNNSQTNHNNEAISQKNRQNIQPSTQRGRQAVREFWQTELNILWHLQRYIREGELGNSVQWWQSENYAADYLLRLCLPKAGYKETQKCDWPQLLQLSQSFESLLLSLLTYQ